MGPPETVWPVDYEASHAVALVNTINIPCHLAKKTLLMFVECMNNGLVTCGALWAGFLGALLKHGVISTDPPPLVSESCQMIREPAWQLFGRDKQQ